MNVLQQDCWDDWVQTPVASATDAPSNSRKTLGGEQFSRCFLRPPVPAVPTKRCRVRVDKTNQHLCHNPAPYWTKTMTSCAGVAFAENVVPQRSLTPPARGGDANLLRSERGDTHVTGHSLARRKPHTLTALQVTDGERMIGFDLALTGDGYLPLHECPDEHPDDFL